MTIITRAIIGLITGLIGGAILGAVVVVLFFLPQYLLGRSFFEHLHHLVIFAGYMGGVSGLIAGGIIGLIVGVFRPGKLYGALVGVCVILILALYLSGSTAFV